MYIKSLFLSLSLLTSMDIFSGKFEKLFWIGALGAFSYIVWKQNHINNNFQVKVEELEKGHPGRSKEQINAIVSKLLKLEAGLSLYQREDNKLSEKLEDSLGRLSVVMEYINKVLFHGGVEADENSIVGQYGLVNAVDLLDQRLDAIESNDLEAAKTIRRRRKFRTLSSLNGPNIKQKQVLS